jgi:hypothetical protein
MEQDEIGEPVTRIRPRALMISPGFPDFMSRARFVRRGTVVLEGRAWSGEAPIETVEVSVDGGHSWSSADLEPAGEHPWAWRRWTSTWLATPRAPCAHSAGDDRRRSPTDESGLEHWRLRE